MNILFNFSNISYIKMVGTVISECVMIAFTIHLVWKYFCIPESVPPKPDLGKFDLQDALLGNYALSV